VTEFVLTRSDIPILAAIDHDHLAQQVGGQWEWCWATALPYRALNAPSIGLPMPSAPREGEDFFNFLGYWTALQSFLTYSFGWTRHDRGLRWWYESGKPVGDPRFALIDAVWERDGNLLRYAEWCHDRLAWFDHQAIAVWTDYDPTPDALPSEWALRLKRARDDEHASMHSPYGKHLENGDHASWPTHAPHTGSLTIVDAAQRAATYTSDTVSGWYRGLAELGVGLPPLTNASWRVDVYVRSIGFLGTYRRSRVTGLWFSGPHRFHFVGN
jgi:hypothetical protein